MIRKYFFILLCLQIKLFSFSQPKSEAYQNFFHYFLNVYKELSKPPINNYYDVLSNSAKLTFTLSNPFLKDALMEISKTLNVVDDDIALDTLFKRVYRDLRRDYLWASIGDIFKTYKPVYDVYSKSLCPCMSASIEKSDLMQQLIATLQSCSAKLMNDSTFIQNIRTVAGDKTINELYKHQQYFSAYVYENCEIMNYKFNETIFRYPVSEQYFTILSGVQIARAENSIKYFSADQNDSLSLIFPKHKLYTKELNKIASLQKQNGIVISSSYIRVAEDKIPQTILGLYRSSIKIAEVTFTNSAQSISSEIIKIKFQTYSLDKNQDDKIIELKVKKP